MRITVSSIAALIRRGLRRRRTRGFRKWRCASCRTGPGAPEISPCPTGWLETEIRRSFTGLTGTFPCREIHFCRVMTRNLPAGVGVSPRRAVSRAEARSVMRRNFNRPGRMAHGIQRRAPPGIIRTGVSLCANGAASEIFRCRAPRQPRLTSRVMATLGIPRPLRMPSAARLRGRRRTPAVRRHPLVKRIPGAVARMWAAEEIPVAGECISAEAEAIGAAEWRLAAAFTDKRKRGALPPNAESCFPGLLFYRSAFSSCPAFALVAKLFPKNKKLFSTSNGILRIQMWRRPWQKRNASAS